MRYAFYFIIVLNASGLLAQDQYHQAEKLYFDGDHEQALKAINQEIQNTPEPQDFLLRALIHESLGFFSNANDDFVQAIRLDEEFYEAYFHFAEFLNNTNDYEKAVASLTLLLNKIDQGETKGIFFKMDQNGLEPTSVTTLSGMKSEILTNRSTSYQKLGMLDLALEDINMALSIDESAGRLVNRSLLFSELNQNTNAIRDLRRAVSIAPDNALAWYNLFLLDRSTEIPTSLNGMDEFGPMLSLKGIEAMELGDTRKAAELFEQALVLTPNDASLLLNSGRLDFKNQQFASAQQKFESALKNDSSKKEAIYLLGNALFGQGDFEQALEKYSAYLKVDPTSGDVWFNSGMAYLELDDTENACMCLERASDFGMKRA
ncbi:MAG: tetratricopeptide repeat protein, partial [Cyclobacteriaceae bacterium]